jgi:hypothetical protein
MAPIYSILANRKDKANQPFWTEYRVPAVDGCCPAQPGAIVLLGPDCKIDPCLLPTGPDVDEVFVNGTAVLFGPAAPNFNNLTPAPPAGSSNVFWQTDGSGNISAYYTTSGTTVHFDQILSGTNTVATMVVGSGATLTVECGSTGVIEATELATDTCTPVVTNISHPTHPGMLLISQPGNTSAAWMDPQVQGLYAAGSTICPAPAYVPPTCIQPILIGGADCNGVLQNISVTTGGKIVTLTQDQETDINVLRFGATTGAALKTNATAALVPLLSIRPKVAATAVTFTLRNSDFLSGGNLSHYQLLLNATLTGASFVNVDAASQAQYDVSATSYTGGRLIDSGFVGADHERHDYEMHFGFTGGTPDTITLVYVGAVSTGTPKSIAGCSFAWDEQATCL